MKKLTENLIQQRLKSCTKDLHKVLQINVTGRDLEDVSLLQKMTGVEILSFSVNSITSLADFRYCKNLKELYLRNNKIQDLEQISYLKNLPKLKLLMLSENPCTKDPLYRMTVIKNLKYLTELDGVPIKMEERRQAQKLGKAILAEDEEDELKELNTNTSNQNLSKLNKSEDNLIEVKDPREQREMRELREFREITETKEIKEVKEPRETKEPKELTEVKLLKEEELVNKLTIQNDQKGYTVMDNQEENSYLSSTNETDRSETEQFSKRKLKTKFQRPSLCRYCGERERPQNYNLLSATINLVQELDYQSLQIVHAEVNSYLNFYETDVI